MGGKQLGFSDDELTTARKQTKREKFLAEMEVVVPWAALIALIEPHYPKASKKGGRPPYTLAMMLRIHLLQQWSSLSDPAMEEALIVTPTMRRFAGIELISDRIPVETGQPVVFRYESPRRRGQKLRPDPFSGGYVCQCSRPHASSRSVAWR